jgi:two-component system, NarL family, response regulator NreC
VLPMRILVADDNKMIRGTIVEFLARESGINVCGEASDSADAIQKVTELHPDVVLLDISMPGENGLETARFLKEKFPEIKILIVSQHDCKQMLPPSLEAGASGCIDKARLALDLLPAINALETTSFRQPPP